MNRATSIYLTSLFSETPRNLGIELRPIRVGTGEAVSFCYTSRPDSLERCSRKCRELAADHDVYIGVLPRHGRGTEDRDVPGVGWLWVDVDAGDSDGTEIAHLLAAARLPAEPLPRPAMIVHSGSGGVHLYWKLTEIHPLPDVAERRNLSSVLRRLCAVIGGRSPGAHADTACVNPSRILRVPGTLNHKRQPPRAVELQLPDSPDVRPFVWWRSHLPSEPQTPVGATGRSPLQHAAASSTAWGVLPGLVRWATEGYPEGRRHLDLAGAAKFLKIDCGLADSRGYDLLRMKASRSRGARAITERELEHIWKWA